jgi:regulator of sirC expression with transglutaminase-like and TPR domain
MTGIDGADAAALLEAAMAISMHELGEIDCDHAHRQLNHLANAVRSRVPNQVEQLLARQPINPEPVLAHLHDVLFEEAHFRGNLDDYYDPHNSYISSVLESRRGIPITLTMIYKCVAEQIGLHVHGINTPGHFLAAIDLPACACASTQGGGEGGCGKRMYIDPFNGGRIMRREEVCQLLERTLGSHVPMQRSVLSPASNRQWLHRMLQNLQNIFAFNHREKDLAAMQEMTTLLQRG